MTVNYVVCALAEFPPGSRRLLNLPGRSIAVFNVDDQLYAVDDSCPHAGSSLSVGQLNGTFVHCRAHGLRFNLRTGEFRPGSELCVATYSIFVKDGQIILKLPDLSI